MSHKILVLGDGGWGTALAILLSNKAYQVKLWGKFPEYAEELKKTRENTKFLPGVKIPTTIEITADAEESLKGIDLIVMAVPTQHIRSVLQEIVPFYPGETPIVSVAKGIENKTLLRPTEIIQELLGKPRIGVISGPSHAEEVSRGLPATVVSAAGDENFAREMQQIFMTDRFRVYTNTDIITNSTTMRKC